MKKYHFFISFFCFLASIFVAGIFFIKRNKNPIVAASEFFRPAFFDDVIDVPEEEIEGFMKCAAKPITLEINGEKHFGILSLDFFSFSDALDFCESKGLKMPNWLSEILEAHENEGKKGHFCGIKMK